MILERQVFEQGRYDRGQFHLALLFSCECFWWAEHATDQEVFRVRAERECVLHGFMVSDCE